MKTIRLIDKGDGQLPKVLQADAPAPAGKVYLVEARNRLEAARCLTAYKQAGAKLDAWRLLEPGDLSDQAQLALRVREE